MDRQGKRHKKPGPGRKEVATFPFCASGDCDLGKTIAAEIGPMEPRAAKRARNWGSVPALVLAAAKRKSAAANEKGPPTPATPAEPPDHPAPSASPDPTTSPGHGREPPASPAQETTPMPCTECKSPTRHKAECSKATKPKLAASPPAKKAAEPPKPTKKVSPAKPAPTPKRKAPPAANGPAYVMPVRDLADEDLARSIAECRAELERRQAEHEARAKKLAEVIASIGEAA